MLVDEVLFLANSRNRYSCIEIWSSEYESESEATAEPPPPSMVRCFSSVAVCEELSPLRPRNHSRLEERMGNRVSLLVLG